jgi:hypothetical protein
MPFIEPSRGDVHVDGLLSNVSLAFQQRAENFVANRVFPDVTSDKRSNLYLTYDRGDFNRDEMEERAPGTESAGSTYGVANDNYFCRVRSLHRDIPDQIRSNADDPFDLDREATIFVTTKGMINREINWAAAYFTAGDPGDTWTFDVDGAASRSSSFDPTDAAENNVVRWDLSASTPIEDIRQGKRFVLEETGYMPNTLTLGRVPFDVLLDHGDIVNRLDSGQTPGGPARATRESLAALFEVDEILVMDSVVNTAAKNAANVHSFIGANNALLSYKPPTPGLMTPSAGYTFTWNGYLGASETGSRIKVIRADLLESDRVEIDMAYDQKLVSADLGYFFGAIAINA